MPAKMLSSLAKKAGKSLKKAEECWNKAKESYEKRKGSISNKYAYIMGTTKKMLGLEDIDLVMAGIPADLVMETYDDIANNTCDSVEKAFLPVALNEILKVEMNDDSNIFGITDSGIVITKPKFMAEMQMQLKEKFSIETLRNLFPNIDIEYVTFLGESMDFAEDDYSFDDEDEYELGEEDIYCEDHSGPFYYTGKKIADNPLELSRWMRDNNYYPNIWWISDHGNPVNITTSVFESKNVVKRRH